MVGWEAWDGGFCAAVGARAGEDAAGVEVDGGAPDGC